MRKENRVRKWLPRNLHETTAERFPKAGNVYSKSPEGEEAGTEEATTSLQVCSGSVRDASTLPS